MIRVGPWALKCETKVRFPISFLNDLHHGIRQIQNNNKSNSRWRSALINDISLFKKLGFNKNKLAMQKIHPERIDRIQLTNQYEVLEEDDEIIDLLKINYQDMNIEEVTKEERHDTHLSKEIYDRRQKILKKVKHIKTKEEKIIKERNVVLFKPSKDFKKFINENNEKKLKSL